MRGSRFLYVGLLSLAVSGALSCGEPSSPTKIDTPIVPPDTTTVPTLPAFDAVLSPGMSATRPIKSSFVVAIDLQAGDTVDIGFFGAGTSNMADPNVEIDTRFTQSALTFPEKISHYRHVILPAVPIHTTGRRVLRFTALTYSPPLTGSVEFQVRRSAPIATMTFGSSQAASFLESQSRASLAQRITEPVLDSVLFRNAGLGNAMLQLSIGSPLSLSSADVALAGPVREEESWVARSLQHGFAEPGLYEDTLRIDGATADRFNSGIPAKVALSVRLYEADASLHPYPAGAGNVAVMPAGQFVFTSNRALRSYDPSTGASALLDSMPGVILTNGHGLAALPDGTLYLAIYLNNDYALWKRSPGGTYQRVFGPITTADFAVLPDGSIYILGRGDGFTEQLLRIPPDLSAAAVIREFPKPGSIPRGMVFHPQDSSLYYSDGDSLYRRDLKDGVETALGDFDATPRAVDSSGRIYLATPISGEIVTVISSEGNVLYRHWGPMGATHFAVSDSYLVAMASVFIWSVPTR